MGQSNTSTAIKTVAYCTTCEEDFGEAKEECLGEKFICPKECPESSQHFSRVVKGNSGIFWLKLEKALLTYETKLSAMWWFRKRRGFFRDKAGRYLTLRFLVILAGAFIADFRPDSSLLQWALRIPLIVLALYSIIDILLATTSITFVSRFPANALRSTVFALFGLLQIGVSFAILYSLFPSGFGRGLSTFEAIYFSMLTITTLGDPDVQITAGAWIIKSSVIAELFIGIYFIAVLVGIITAWAGGLPRPAARRLLTQVLKS